MGQWRWWRAPRVLAALRRRQWRWRDGATIGTVSKNINPGSAGSSLRLGKLPQEKAIFKRYMRRESSQISAELNFEGLTNTLCHGRLDFFCSPRVFSM
jgi:hypothetical protein